jgi:hypothetical protein
VAQHQIALTFDVWTIFGGQDDGEKIMFNLVAALLVLPVLGLGGLQGDGLAASRSVRVPRVRDLLLRHYPVDFYELQHCLLTASVLTVGFTLIVSRLAGLITSSSPGDKADF